MISADMEPIKSITRRDFLNLAQAGGLGMALRDLQLGEPSAAPPTSQGRIVRSGIGLYDEPAFQARKTHVFGRDEVVRLTGQVEGDEGNPYNAKWYQVDGGGYTYSGWVQPVETRFQRAVFDIPRGAQVGEITTPVCVTRLEPRMQARNGLRLYYGSTHWVRRVHVRREEKGIWYEIYDSHLKASFYVPYQQMRLVPDEELSLLSPDVPESLKTIHVDLRTQLVTAFEGDTMVLSERCSSGAGRTRTPLGDFRTYHKGPSIHMSNEGDAEANVFDLPGVPWVSFFTGTGVAFHGTYWHNDYGRPRSHGCVNLPMEAAKFIYRWTRPTLPPDTEYVHLPGAGTRVEVVKSAPAALLPIRILRGAGRSAWPQQWPRGSA
jgi:hypothetical protein